MLADVNAFLGCGDPARSHAILRCFKCHIQRTIPLSCKRRSFCEPCGVRRQQDRTKFLQDQIFGSRPVRLWTMTLPYPFRIELGTDSKLVTKFLAIVLKVIYRYIQLTLRRILKLRSMKLVYPGSVTVIHRTSRNLDANLHFHCLLLDGAYVRRALGEPLEFVDLPTPTDDDVAKMSRDICRRVRHALWRDNRWEDLRDDGAPLDGSLVAGTFLTEDGRPAKCRLTGIAAGRTYEVPKGVSAFNLRASTAIRANDPKNLRRLIKYLLAPPFSEKQLRPVDGGMVLELHRPRANGTKSWFFTDEEFFDRLGFLVPPPRANILRYGGVFAPNCSFRKEAVPEPARDHQPSPTQDNDETPEDYAAWAELKTHSFGCDVTRCPVCRGRLQLIALKTDRITYRRRGVSPDIPREAEAA
jgi:hypothetical protein